MYDNYADVLESYLIPAEEGVVKDLWNSAGTLQKSALISSGAVLAGTAIAKGVKAFKDRNKSKSTGPDISTSKNDKNSEYWKNAEQVIARMQEECPEVIKKELDLRKYELKKMSIVIDQLSRKKLPSSYSLNSSNIKNYLKDPENAIDYFDEEITCEFLTSILPGASPKLFTTDYDINCPQWCFYSYYNIEIGNFDIFDWLLDEKGVSTYKHGSDEEDEFWNTYMDFRNMLVRTFSGKFKCFQGIFGESDKGEGGYFEIVFKPSDEFIKVAKTYGYHE